MGFGEAKAKTTKKKAMNLFRRSIRKKTGYGGDESTGINWFNVLLLGAAVFFMCSLLGVLLWPVLFERPRILFDMYKLLKRRGMLCVRRPGWLTGRCC